MSARKVFHDSIVPLPAEPGAAPGGLIVNAQTPGRPDEDMEIHFSLSVADNVESLLEEKVAKGKADPPEELEKLYATAPGEKDALVSWLKSNGYQIVHESRDGI